MSRPSGGLTTRAAVLGLVVCALVVSAALPLREYLSQRGEIGRLEAQAEAARQRVAALEEQKDRLQDPSYVTALARQRLHYVKPGETAYVVLGGPTQPPRPSLTGQAATPVGPEAPWYSQLWGTVRAADRER